MKSTNTIHRFGMLLVLISCGMMGCHFRASAGRGVKNIFWSRSGQDARTIPGITEADVSIYTWNDDAAFVIWTDGKPGTRGTEPRKHGDPHGSARYHCMIGNLSVDCLTTDGKTGKVKIGDQSYDLSDGRLILLATKGEKPRVKQLALAKLDLKPEGKRSDDQVTLEQLQDLAKTDPDILAFFTDTAPSVESPAR